ncbi:MAG: phenylalanyl-tRNA synthetase beta chain, partial [Candidatus Omnitrophota bacterium]
PPKPPIIKLNLETIRRIFGKDFSLKKATVILKNLGFVVSAVKANTVSVTGCNSRLDIREEIDLTEELIRLYGFENIDEAIPVTRHIDTPAKLSNYSVTRQLKEMLVAQGFWEAVSLSLVSRQRVSQMQISAKEPLIAIKNPLSLEQEVLRPLALCGLLDALAHNANRKEKDLMLFEVGKRYLGGVERESLALLISGDIQNTWAGKAEASFYYLKGVIESVYARFNKPMPNWKSKSPLPQTLMNAVVDGDNQNEISFCGELQSVVLNEWGIESRVYYAEILLDDFFDLLEKKQVFKTLPKFPPVKRDVAILAEESVSIKDIEKCVRKTAQKHLTRFFLFDEYHGKSIPKGKRSLAFSLQYEKENGTFTDEEIINIHTAVIDELIQKHGIEIR